MGANEGYNIMPITARLMARHAREQAISQPFSINNQSPKDPRVSNPFHAHYFPSVLDL